MTKLRGYISEPNQTVTKYFTDSFDCTVSMFEERPDFIVVPGGPDINPKLYLEKEELQTTSAMVKRDYHEFSDMILARLKGIPIIGICRGAQMLHVLNGGRLIQHLSAHEVSSNQKVYDAEFKEVPDFVINSTHHQGIPTDDRIGYEVALHGSYEHGFIYETFLDVKNRYFGCQYHPEYETCSKEGRAFFNQNVKELLGVK